MQLDLLEDFCFSFKLSNKFMSFGFDLLLLIRISLSLFALRFYLINMGFFFSNNLEGIKLDRHITQLALACYFFFVYGVAFL